MELADLEVTDVARIVETEVVLEEAIDVVNDVVVLFEADLVAGAR